MQTSIVNSSNNKLSRCLNIMPSLQLISILNRSNSLLNPKPSSYCYKFQKLKYRKIMNAGKATLKKNILNAQEIQIGALFKFDMLSLFVIINTLIKYFLYQVFYSFYFAFCLSISCILLDALNHENFEDETH